MKIFQPCDKIGWIRPKPDVSIGIADRCEAIGAGNQRLQVLPDLIADYDL